MSKFATLKDLAGKGDDKKPTGKKGKEDFVGGGASGLNVVNPGRDDDDDDGEDHVEKIFKKQSEGTAEGDVAVITFWKNGFTVDDGDVRSVDAPENKSFIAALNRGEIPDELMPRLAARSKRTGEDITAGVTVQDKRSETWTPPPYRAFGGAGATLGAAASAPVAASAVVKGGGAATAAALVVDASKPVANMQVKLLDGRREKVTLNLSHTVADLQTKVASLGGTTKAFVLTAGFPPKVLDNPSLTLEAAGLKAAQVTQKEA